MQVALYSQKINESLIEYDVVVIKAKTGTTCDVQRMINPTRNSMGIDLSDITELDKYGRATRPHSNNIFRWTISVTADAYEATISVNSYMVGTHRRCDHLVERIRL